MSFEIPGISSLAIITSNDVTKINATACGVRLVTRLKGFFFSLDIHIEFKKTFSVKQVVNWVFHKPVKDTLICGQLNSWPLGDVVAKQGSQILRFQGLIVLSITSHPLPIELAPVRNSKWSIINACMSYKRRSVNANGLSWGFSFGCKAYISQRRTFFDICLLCRVTLFCPSS